MQWTLLYRIKEENEKEKINSNMIQAFTIYFHVKIKKILLNNFILM